MHGKPSANLVLSVFDGAPLRYDSTQRFFQVLFHISGFLCKLFPQDQDRGMHTVIDL